MLKFATQILRTLVLLLAAGASCANAAPAPKAAADAALEKHVLAISEELRCLVCQNQTIADSHADLALDLRNQVREKLQQGYSDSQVIDFMVQRYGDFVLYRPPVKPITWLLWFGPFALLLGGLIFLGVKLKQQRARTQEREPQLSAAQMQRAAALLDADGDQDHKGNA